MADTRPIVFVASSARHEAVVQALAAQMESFAIPDPWVDGQAELADVHGDIEPPPLA